MLTTDRNSRATMPSVEPAPDRNSSVAAVPATGVSGDIGLDALRAPDAGMFGPGGRDALLQAAARRAPPTLMERVVAEGLNLAQQMPITNVVNPLAPSAMRDPKFVHAPTGHLEVGVELPIPGKGGVNPVLNPDGTPKTETTDREPSTGINLKERWQKLRGELKKVACSLGCEGLYELGASLVDRFVGVADGLISSVGAALRSPVMRESTGLEDRSPEPVVDNGVDFQVAARERRSNDADIADFSVIADTARRAFESVSSEALAEIREKIEERHEASINQERSEDRLKDLLAAHGRALGVPESAIIGLLQALEHDGAFSQSPGEIIGRMELEVARARERELDASEVREELASARKPSWDLAF